jgi:VanZ family protein
VDSHSIGVKHLPFANADKVVHAILFGVLVVCSWFFAENKWNGSGLILLYCLFLISAGYGTGMEFYQKYFTTRAFELSDIIADTIGAALGAIFCNFFKKRRPL